MKNNIFFKTPFLILIFFLTSCISKKSIIYLQKDEIEQEKVSNKYVTTFKPDDLLLISVISQDVEAAAPFNLPAVIAPNSGANVIGQVTQLPYLVDSNGEIDFPILGKFKIAGLTREEAIQLLKNKLKPKYLKDPNIYIRITNFTINVTGAVKRPGTQVIQNERVTILDALSLAGDLNISAKRDNILVIREENNKKVEYRVNLLSRKLYTSPVFYLQQNDNIYVEPNYASIQSASRNSNTSLFISVTSLLITVATFLIRL